MTAPDPYLYPWWTVNYFLLLWIASVVIKKTLQTVSLAETSKVFDDLDGEKKRNVITYFLEIVVTTFSLVSIFVGGTGILFRREEFVEMQDFDWIRMALLALSALYVWELIYRERFGVSLLLHHLITLLFTQLVVATVTDVGLYNVGAVWYLRAALILGFSATTEQLSFVALSCYRLDWLRHVQGKLFYAAAFQSFLFKTATFVGGVILYFRALPIVKEEWGLAWKILFLPLLTALYVAQLYAVNILSILGKRCENVAPPLYSSGHLYSSTSTNHSKPDAGETQVLFSKPFFYEGVGHDSSKVAVDETESTVDGMEGGVGSG